MLLHLILSFPFEEKGGDMHSKFMVLGALSLLAVTTAFGFERSPVEFRPAKFTLKPKTIH